MALFPYVGPTPEERQQQQLNIQLEQMRIQELKEQAEDKKQKREEAAAQIMQQRAYDSAMESYMGSPERRQKLAKIAEDASKGRVSIEDLQGAGKEISIPLQAPDYGGTIQSLMADLSDVKTKMEIAKGRGMLKEREDLEKDARAIQTKIRQYAMDDMKTKTDEVKQAGNYLSSARESLRADSSLWGVFQPRIKEVLQRTGATPSMMNFLDTPGYTKEVDAQLSALASTGERVGQEASMKQAEALAVMAAETRKEIASMQIDSRRELAAERESVAANREHDKEVKAEQARNRFNVTDGKVADLSNYLSSHNGDSWQEGKLAVDDKGNSTFDPDKNTKRMDPSGWQKAARDIYNRAKVIHDKSLEGNEMNWETEESALEKAKEEWLGEHVYHQRVTDRLGMRTRDTQSVFLERGQKEQAERDFYRKSGLPMPARLQEGKKQGGEEKKGGWKIQTKGKMSSDQEAVARAAMKRVDAGQWTPEMAKAFMQSKGIEVQ